jgi:hypothetical protein
MREFFAALAALFGALAGFFITAFVGCLVAIQAESLVMGLVAVGLAIAAAIGGGYLGAKLVLGNPPTPPHGSMREGSIIRRGSMPNLVCRPKPDDKKEQPPAAGEAESKK